MTDWAGIDEFVCVAQTLSFSKAAKRLGLSPSQVSREIARLEDRLGLQLFYRTTRHVNLTDTGETFFAHCKRLVEDREEAISSVSAADGSLKGDLRMTCSLAYGERFIVPLINEFAINHPNLSVQIELTDEILDLAANGLDLAVRFGRLRDSGLIATRLSSRMRLLCASPAYLAAHGAPKGLDDLDNHTCLRGVAANWRFARGGELYEFKPHGRWRCNSGTAVLDAALRGMGICQLPDFYVRESLNRGDLMLILDQYRPPDEGVWAVYAHRRNLAAKIRLMLDHLQSRIKPDEGIHVFGAR